MKKALTFLLFLVLTIHSYAQNKTDNKETAKTVLNLMLKNDFNKVMTYCDSSFARRMTAEKLEKSWETLMATAGVFVKVVSTTEEDKNFFVIVQKCEFEKKVIGIRMAFNTKGRIAGLSSFTDHPKDSYQLPSYYDSTKVEERKIEIVSGVFTLPGTLTLPTKGNKFPVVVLVQGASATDQDESVGATKMFKDLALGLAAKGVATVRFDKRMRTFSNQPPPLRKIPTVKEETTDDVIAAVGSLKNYSTLDMNRIFLLGHNLGGMLLPRIVKELPQVAGLFLMAANARPLEDVMADQSIYLFTLDSMTEKKETYLDTLKKQVERIKLLKSNDNDSTPAKRFLRLPKSYWIDLNTYHQTEVAKELTIPIYILQGERDYQVTMKDFDLWKKNLSGKRNVTFKSYPKLNHIFIEGEGKGSPYEYDRKGNVASFVMDDLVNWINAK